MQSSVRQGVGTGVGLETGADVGLRTQQPSTHVSKLLLMHRKISTVGLPVLQSSVGQNVGAGVGLETGAEVIGADETGAGVAGAGVGLKTGAGVEGAGVGLETGAEVIGAGETGAGVAFEFFELFGVLEDLADLVSVWAEAMKNAARKLHGCLNLRNRWTSLR